MNAKRSETLLRKVDANTDLLIQRLSTILALSTSTTSEEIQASEMLQIESSSATIVRLVEELLSISRTLKENWILSQLPDTKVSDDPTIGISDKINDVLDQILRNSQFEEEIKIEDASDAEQPKEESNSTNGIDSLKNDTLQVETEQTTKIKEETPEVETNIKKEPDMNSELEPMTASADETNQAEKNLNIDDLNMQSSEELPDKPVDSNDGSLLE